MAEDPPVCQTDPGGWPQEKRDDEAFPTLAKGVWGQRRNDALEDAAEEGRLEGGASQERRDGRDLHSS